MKVKIVPKRLNLNQRQHDDNDGTEGSTKSNQLRVTKRQLEPVVNAHEVELNETTEPDDDAVETSNNAGAEASADAEAAPGEEEYEQVLTPQLQELLEYMADDEKVYMIKGSQLQAVANLLHQSLNLRETVNELTRKLQDVSTMTTQLHQLGRELDQLRDSQSKALAKAQTHAPVRPEQETEREPEAESVVAPSASKVKVSTRVAPRVAIPAVVKQRAAAAAAPSRQGRGSTVRNNRKGAATAVAAVSAKESLVELLEKYKKNTDANGSKKIEINTGDAERMNTFFDMVYILNINGKGVKLGEALQEYGLTKCQVIEADLPKKVLPFQKPFHFMRDAVENAKENGHKKIVVLHDNVLPHKRFTIEFKEIADQFEAGGQAGDWDIIQFGFTRKINNHKPTSFDWEYYTDAYPGLLLKSEKEAAKHWKQKGFRDGRIGAREIFQDDDLTHVFAVAVSSSIFDKLLNQLEIGINNSKAEHNVVGSLKCIIYGVRPNLFIRLDPIIGDKAAEYKKFQWHLDSYLTI